MIQLAFGLALYEKLAFKVFIVIAQAVRVFVPHPRGKQKMMYMQFGSGVFAATMNARAAGLK